MKITKYEHACLLVEMPEPINRTALFDPGMMSESVLNIDDLEFLDDIIITHSHTDHLSLVLLKQLVEKFPSVRITGPADVVDLLEKEDITASSDQCEGLKIFTSPHASVAPLFLQPDQIGVHYLDTLTHPGDSHQFAESKAILALPITAPWCSTVEAVELALELKPQYVVPIHDWHWKAAARQQMYGLLEAKFAEADIVFLPIENGVPVLVDASTD